MEYFTAQIRHNYTKVKIETMQQPENSGEVEKGSMEAIRKQSSSQKIDFLNFHKEKKLSVSTYILYLYLYLLHSLLQVGIQTVLLCLLTFKHLPIMRQSKTHCSTNSCSTSIHCLIRNSPGKRMSIYGLITLSTINISLGSGYFIYSIHHYLLEARSASKIQIY